MSGFGSVSTDRRRPSLAELIERDLDVPIEADARAFLDAWQAEHAERVAAAVDQKDREAPRRKAHSYTIRFRNLHKIRMWLGRRRDQVRVMRWLRKYPSDQNWFFASYDAEDSMEKRFILQLRSLKSSEQTTGMPVTLREVELAKLGICPLWPFC